MNLQRLALLIVFVTVFQFLSLFSTAIADEAGFSSSRTSLINNGEKSGQVGVGFQVGGLSGPTVEIWNSHRTAINITMLSDQAKWGFGVAHNWMFYNSFASSGRTVNYFVPYVGVGLLTRNGWHRDYLYERGEATVLAVQVPLGIEFLPYPERFGIFGEIIPNIAVLPFMTGFTSADIGARFYF